MIQMFLEKLIILTGLNKNLNGIIMKQYIKLIYLNYLY